MHNSTEAIVVIECPVHRHSVVPHNNIAILPFVSILKLLLCGMKYECFDEVPRSFVRHIVDSLN